MSVRLFAATCGWLTMRYDFFVEDEAGMVAIPIPSYLIQHPKGTVVFDSGLETALQSRDQQTVHTALGTMSGEAVPTFVAGDEVSARLNAFGVDPDRVDFLINSHLHLDHCGGNALIPNAQWVVQKREWQAARTPEGQEQNHYQCRHYDLGHSRLEVDGEHDLFGDGSVTCIPTFGHTPGHQSLRVQLDDGVAVLTSDACYMRKSLEQMRLPVAKVVSDEKGMRDTFRRLQALKDAGTFLIYGHDPDQWRSLNRGPMQEITARALASEARAAAAAFLAAPR